MYTYTYMYIYRWQGGSLFDVVLRRSSEMPKGDQLT